MNMKFKRILSMVTVLAVILSMMPMGIAAGVTEAAVRPAFKIDDVRVAAGEQVVIPVQVENNIGFGSTSLYFELPDGWTLSNMKLYDAAYGRTILQYFNEDMGSYSSNYNPTINVAKQSFTVAAQVLEDMSANGNLLYLVVSVPEDCESGKYKIGVSTDGVFHAYDAYTDVQDQFDYVSGTVTVDGVEPATGLTRAELAEMVAEKFEDVLKPTGEQIVFNDIDGCTEAQQEAIILLAQNGIVAGNENGEFMPHKVITDKKAALIIYRAMSGELDATPDEAVNMLIKEGVLDASEITGEAADAETVADWLDNITVEITTGTLRVLVSGLTQDDMVTVYIYKNYENGDILTQGTTNGNYEFTFEDIEEGTYAVTAECEGYEIGYYSIAVYADEVTEIEFQMVKKETPDYLSMLQAEGSDVTIQNGLNTEVTVTLEATGDMELYGIAGNWDVEELDGEGFLSLKEIGSDVLTFKGMNYADVNTGHVEWTDETFEAPAVLSKGTKLLTATYIVNGDMPAGSYTVRFRSDTLTGNDFEPNETETYYKAKINVTRVGDPAETTEITGTVSGVEGNELVTVQLFQIGETEDDATATIYGNGVVTFKKVLPGEYYIKATANGYEDYTSEAFTVDLDGMNHNIVMVKKEVKPPVADGYLGMLAAQDNDVTIYNGEDTEVTVALIGTDDMMVYGIAGNWDLKDQNGGKYMTLSGMGSEILTFSGMNYVEVTNGHVEWTDDSFEAPAILSSGTKLLTATYAVDGDTPEGEYIVRFFAGTLTADDFEPDESGAYYTATITVKHHTHVPGDAVEENLEKATCEADGSYDLVVYCADESCGMELSRTGKIIEMLGHAWSETAYDFAEDGKSCTATRVCERDENHVEEVAAEITFEVKEDATCTETGWTTYTATFNVDWAETQTVDVEDIPVKGHTYEQEGYNKVVCERCEEVNPAAELKVEALADSTYTYEVVYGVNSRIITVTNDIATKVGYLNTDGAYEKVAAVFVSENEDEGTDTYSFAIPSTDADVGVVTNVLIVVKGDISADGEFKQGDKTLMARALLADTKAAYKALTLTEQFAADVNGDGKAQQGDKTLMARALLADTKAAYKPLGWVD